MLPDVFQRVEAKWLRHGDREIRTKILGKAAHCERVSVKHVDPSLSGMATPSVAAKAAPHHSGAMGNEIPSIVDVALNLPDPERAKLAYRLLQSLKPPKGPSDTNSQFESKLDRRVEDYEAGRTTASDWGDIPISTSIGTEETRVFARPRVPAGSGGGRLPTILSRFATIGPQYDRDTGQTWIDFAPTWTLAFDQAADQWPGHT